MDTTVSEFGISCEACHGPGHEHVRRHRNPVSRYAARLGVEGAEETGSPDALDVVDPIDIDPVRSAQVCGQCHSVSIARRERFDAWMDRGPAFQPGDDLDTTRLVISRSDTDAPELRSTLRSQPDFMDTAFWADGNVRITGREYNGLLRSPCDCQLLQ